MARRIYQLWPSSNRFYFRGLVVSGPKDDFPTSSGPYIIFAIILSLYIYFMLIDMLQHNIILCFGFLLSFTATITFMLLSSFTDPCIIPQRPFLSYLEKQIQQQHDYNYNQLYTIKQYQRIQYLLYQNSDVHQVFCTTCNIYRPSSTSHCRRCDSCILEIDHHCPWLNTCVGKNNYKWFILFIGSLIVMMVAFCCNVVVWVDYVTMTEQKDDKQSNNSILNIYVIVCLIIVGLLLIVILGFCMFHIVLKCKGKTTREFIKQNRRKNIRRQENNKQVQRQQYQQQQFKIQVRKSLLLTKEINNNDNDSVVTEQLATSQLKIKLIPQHRYLDKFIRNNCLQSQIFYQQLFKFNSSIRFVNFTQQLTTQDEKFIADKLQEMKQNIREMRENGKVPIYQKLLVIKQ